MKEVDVSRLYQDSAKLSELEVYLKKAADPHFKEEKMNKILFVSRNH